MILYLFVENLDMEGLFLLSKVDMEKSGSAQGMKDYFIEVGKVQFRTH
jgi:hypothetical protein